MSEECIQPVGNGIAAELERATDGDRLEVGNVVNLIDHQIPPDGGLIVELEPGEVLL